MKISAPYLTHCGVTTQDWRDDAAAIWGERWVGPMASALDVNRRTVERWASGKNDIPSGVANALAVAAEAIYNAQMPLDGDGTDMATD